MLGRLARLLFGPPAPSILILVRIAPALRFDERRARFEEECG